MLRWYVGTFERFVEHDAREVYPIESRSLDGLNDRTLAFLNGTREYRHALVLTIEDFIDALDSKILARANAEFYRKEKQ